METISKTRALPVFRMAETEFYVDLQLGEFRQVNAPANRISMNEIRESTDTATELAFDTLNQNIYTEIIDPANIPAHVKLVVVPPLKELDPVGCARKLGLPDHWFTNNQQKVQKRSRQRRHGL
jgi:hypothetical protein